MIGILTFHHVYNYGAILQAFALQTFLANENCDSIILDVRPFRRDPPRTNVRSRWGRYLSGVKYRINLCRPSQKQLRFDSFRESHLILSDEHSSLAECLENYREIDMLIVGSDQVWCPRFGEKAMETYFFRGVDQQIAKVSYAACTGSKRFSVPSLLPYKEDLQRMNSISVRDGFSRDIVSLLVGKPVEIVLDPSLLVNWPAIKWIGDAPVTDPYIFYYGLSPLGDKCVSHFARIYGLSIVEVGMENELPSFKPSLSGENMGPTEWISAIRFSALVVTKSFHGLMISLSLRKPVFVIMTSSVAADRLVDFCDRFGLGDIVLRSEIEIGHAMHRYTSIDWDTFYARLDIEIENSKRFLRRAIRH